MRVFQVMFQTLLEFESFAALRPMASERPDIAVDRAVVCHMPPIVSGEPTARPLTRVLIGRRLELLVNHSDVVFECVRRLVRPATTRVMTDVFALIAMSGQMPSRVEPTDCRVLTSRVLADKPFARMTFAGVIGERVHSGEQVLAVAVRTLEC